MGSLSGQPRSRLLLSGDILATLTFPGAVTLSTSITVSQQSFSRSLSNLSAIKPIEVVVSSNTGEPLDLTISSNKDWLIPSVTSQRITSPTAFSFTIDHEKAHARPSTGIITLTDPVAANSPFRIYVALGTLMDEDRFSYYADYYAYAASAGLSSSRPLAEAAKIVRRVNTDTFERVDDVITARNWLINNLQSSYEIVYAEGHSLNYMRQCFLDLADHVYKNTGQDIDSYLTTHGIKVFSTYASIMEDLGETISASNIKEN